MGNYKFKFSDMLPNAWFFKLKDMSSTTSKARTSKPQLNKKQHHPHPIPPPPPPLPTPPPPITTSSSLSSSSTSSTTSTSSSLPFPPTTNSQRKSYHFTRDLNSPDPTQRIQPPPDTRFLPDPPRRSSKKRRSAHKKRSSIHHRKPAAGCSCTTVWAAEKPDCHTPESYPNSSSGDEMLQKELGSGRGSFDEMVSSLTTTTTCHPCKSKDNDDVDINISPSEKFILPPIITKTSATLEQQQPPQQRRRLPAANSPAAGLSRLRLRANSPRIMGGSRIRVQVNNGRRSSVSSSTTTTTTTTTVSSAAPRRRGRNRSLSESFAVVKASVDPGRDFKESMVEMIKENNLRGSKDLEELLACYLSLNSDEYHELIIKVFKQIWFDINEIQFN